MIASTVREKIELAPGFEYDINHRKRVTVLAGSEIQCGKSIRIITSRLLRPGDRDVGEPLGAHDDVSGRVIQGILDSEKSNGKIKNNLPIFSMLKDLYELTDTGVAMVKENAQLISIDTQDKLFEKNTSYAVKNIMGLDDGVLEPILDKVTTCPIAGDNQILMISLVTGSVTISSFNN